MAQTFPIALLEERRRALVAESARHRQQLTDELARLRSATTWIDTGFSLARSLLAYGPVLATAVSLLRTRERGGMLRALRTSWSLWQLARKLARLWGQPAPDDESGR